MLFVGVPLLELALLIRIGEWVGVLPTVALVVVTGIAGASLARWQGLSTLARFRAATGQGRLPHEELVEGVLILLAGAVLLTPGLLTDICGFSLLVPGVRRAVARRLIGRFKERVLVVSGDGMPRVPSRGDPDAVDVEFTVANDEETQPRRIDD